MGRAPDYRLSLPLDEPLAWYAGGEGPDRAQERVERGAPQRLTPLDQPDGSFDPIPTSDEVSRIEAQAQGLDANLRRLLRRPRHPALGAKLWRLSGRGASGPQSPWQSVDIALQNTLLMQAMDPGIARYFGLMANLDEGPEQPPSGWTAAAVFAIDPDRVLASGQRLKDIVGEPNSFEERIIQNFRRFVPGLNEVAAERLDARDLASSFCYGGRGGPATGPTRDAEAAACRLALAPERRRPEHGLSSRFHLQLGSPRGRSGLGSPGGEWLGSSSRNDHP